jgi:starch-binding outer membrane protein, SusD/RagB family
MNNQTFLGNDGHSTMMDHTSVDPRRGGGAGFAAASRALRVALLPLLLAMTAGACHNLLSVDTPAQIPATGLDVPKNATLLVNGAIGDFECAYGAYVALSAVMAQELTDATQTAARWPYDRRNVHSDDALYGTSGCESLGVYTPLSTARWSAESILQDLQGWSDTDVPNRQDLIATAAAYAGYSYILLGEGFCQVAINESAAMSSDEVLDSAVVRFTTAIQAAQTAGDDSILNLARVGRARAYLDLNQGQSALADAQAVPPDFVYNMTASGSTSRRFNRVFAQSGTPPTGGSALSVADGYLNLAFDGVPDPRVPFKDAGYNAPEGTHIYFQMKYTSLSDPIPIASGTEAQLIIAEVQGGQTAVNIINQLHQAAGLPTFQSTDPQAIANQVIEERARELWLTGHRYYDIRRLNLPLVPAPGTAYRKGGVYGDTRCWPLPDVESLNNPNIG